jgi:protein O-mannosyl-transferase
MNTEQWIPRAPWIAASLIVLVYFPVLHLGYVWDDWHLFVNNPDLRLQEFWLHGILQPVLPGTTYFRPLPLATFALEFSTFGAIPSLSHGVNLAFHAGSSLLVGLIALQLTAGRDFNGRFWRILLAGLLYGLHPALIEPVAWAAGRFDLMVSFFVLLGIWGYLTFRGVRRDLFVVVCFLLAALSKEMAATFPALLLLVYLARQEPQKTWRDVVLEGFRNREWQLYVMIAVAALVVLAMRFLAFGRLAHDNGTVLTALNSSIHHLAFVGHTLVFYAKMTLWPFSDLNPQHPMDPASFGVAARWLGVTAVAVSLASISLLIKKRHVSGLMLAAWLCALLPVLNIIPLTIGGNIGHERFLALPIAFFALSMTTVTVPPLSLYMRKTAPVFLSAIVTLLLTVAALNIRVTIPLWSSEFSLWSWAYARHPDFPFVQASYVGAALRYRNMEAAESAIAKMKEPLSPQLKSVKALYLLRTDRFQQALDLYQEILHDIPITPPHITVSSAGLSLDETRIERGTGLEWNYQSAYTGIAEAYLNLGNYEQALDNSKTAIFYAPRYPSAWMGKAFAFYGLDQWQEGEEAFARAQHYFIPEAGMQAKDIRKKFLLRICDAEKKQNHVCKEWGRQ